MIALLRNCCVSEQSSCRCFWVRGSSWYPNQSRRDLPLRMEYFLSGVYVKGTYIIAILKCISIILLYCSRSAHLTRISGFCVSIKVQQWTHCVSWKRNDVVWRMRWRSKSCQELYISKGSMSSRPSCFRFLFLSQQSNLHSILWMHILMCLKTYCTCMWWSMAS